MAKSILLVDDNLDVCRQLGKALRKDGYDVLEANTGKDALEKLVNDKPQVVLLDTMLPDADGITLCKTMKEMEGVSPKVIVYTGSIDAIDAMRAREMGADDYAAKTTDYEALLKAIENQFET